MLFAPIMKGNNALGYLWAAVSDDAAYFIARRRAGSAGLDAGIAWRQRLLAGKAEGLSPVEFLRRWVGQPEEPASLEAGSIPAGSEQEAASLRDVLRLAGLPV